MEKNQTVATEEERDSTLTDQVTERACAEDRTSCDIRTYKRQVTKGIDLKRHESKNVILIVLRCGY